MLPFDVDDKVETCMGVGRIIEIRHMTDGPVFLVEIQSGGFGRGLCDVFTLDEIGESDVK